MRSQLVMSFAALLIGGAVPAHAGEPAAPPPSKKWMAHCAQNLKGEGLPARVVQKYCACMADIGEEAEMLTWSQIELERSYPPAHRACHIEARGQ
jgi:hypothetical protein